MSAKVTDADGSTVKGQFEVTADPACIRCSLLRPEPTQRPRLVEIRDNLLARIAEAEREGWVGELEGLEVSLAGAQDKLAQLDADQRRRGRSVDLGMPAFRDIAGCDSTSTSPTM